MKELWSIIQSDYQKTRQSHEDDLNKRKEEIYKGIPKILELENRISLLGYEKIKDILKSYTATYPSDSITEIENIEKEIINLLIANEYPEVYLKMEYDCPLCHDTGFLKDDQGIITNKLCPCAKQEIINKSYLNSNLNMSQTHGFNNFNLDYYSKKINQKKYNSNISPFDNISSILSNSKDFVSKFSDIKLKGLYFYGKTGIGKTFLSSCIASELIKSGYTVLYLSAPSLFEEIQADMNFLNDTKTDIEKTLKSVNLLIIDDLGTESQTASRYSKLLDILNTRSLLDYRSPRKTIISTNLSLRDLYDIYTERVGSRIAGEYIISRFYGEDIRIKG